MENKMFPTHSWEKARVSEVLQNYLIRFAYPAIVVIALYARSSEGIDNRIRFPGGLYPSVGVPTQSVENVPIINLPRSQCSARMQRTSATCYFAYNDAAVHANARNHPGDDIKRDRRRHPPEAIHVEGALLPFPVVPNTTEKKRKERSGERGENGTSVFPRDRKGAVAKKSGKWSRLRAAGSIIVPRKITRPSLTRRRLTKCENRRRNWTRYYR